MRLEVKRMGPSWWVVGGDEPAGPYNKTEAEETRKRANRLARHGDEPGYVTHESLKPNGERR